MGTYPAGGNIKPDGERLNLNSQIVVKVDREKESQIEKQLNAVMDENPMLTMGTFREMLEESEKSLVFCFRSCWG